VTSVAPLDRIGPMPRSITLAELGLAPDERPVSGLFLDSRAVMPGGVFFAYPGSQRDGRDFITSAIQKGASCIVYEARDGFSPNANNPIPRDISLIPYEGLQAAVGEFAARFYHHPSASFKLIGVTGTNGKTSVSQFIAQGFHQAGFKTAVMGTVGKGVWPNLSDATHTTDDPIELQHQFAAYRAQDVEYVAMEVSSHALDQGRLSGSIVDTAVFTQLSRDHLDYHGSMEAYAAAKARLFNWPNLARAVINLDDPYGRDYYRALKKSATSCRILTYCLGVNPTEDLMGDADLGGDDQLVVTDKQVISTGYRVSVRSNWGDGQFLCPFFGEFNIANLLASLGVWLLHGMPWEQGLAQLAQLHAAAGRLQCLGGGDLPLVIVDYAHTPDALEKALLALREHCQARLWCVVGCGGDRDRGKRPLMAEIATRLADMTIFTSDNPRSEDPQAIIDEMLMGVPGSDRYQVELDRRAAIAYAVQNADTHDMVLVAGKGHEKTQTIGNQVYPFDDVMEVRLALEIRNPHAN